MQVAERFPEGPVRKSIEVNLALVDALDVQLADLELYLERTVKVEDPQSYHLLKTIPGVGKIPPIVSATCATLERPLGIEEVQAALAEIEDGERARRLIVFGTLDEDKRPRPVNVASLRDR